MALTQSEMTEQLLQAAMLIDDVRNGKTCTLNDTTESIVGMCSDMVRTDNTSVIFKQANK